MTEILTRRRAGHRGDGAATRAQILDAAGRVFAEKGFDRATGKEIAERAGANSAAVNYYYGGIEGLYAAVLVDAHRRLVSYEEIAAVARAETKPREKLRNLIDLAVSSIVGPAGMSWEIRVLSREFLAPSPVFHVLQDREVLPKKRLVSAILAEVLDRPADDPVVERCCLSILAPIAMLLVADRSMIEQTFPELGFASEDSVALAEHLFQFALGGIAAIDRRAASEGGPAGRAARP